MDPSATTARFALIEDHSVVEIGLREILRTMPGWELTAVARSIRELDLETLNVDLVLLDLRLDDGSSPGDNVGALQSVGIPSLAYTAGEDPALLRAAARAGVLGIVRKSESVDVLIDSIQRALRGEAVASTDWAAALDADESLTDARLSPRERHILSLYASGETAQSIAQTTGLSRETVVNYVGRIRTKYALAGRPAATKVELHIRAHEDGILSSRKGQKT